MLVHFYPLECKIQLMDSNYKTENIYNIRYDNNDAFYTLIKNNKINSTSLKIKPLIFLLNEEIKNRSCPLIINSIEINENHIPQLFLKDKEIAFLYFNKNLEKINLLYEFNKNDIKSPIIVSFFIKEKLKFNIEISVNKNIIINKNISYKENIIIPPKYSNKNYKIKISPFEKNIISTMIVKINHDNSSPFYLQKNVFNLGFIPKEVEYQYYYMKVYNGQEGEIILHNKRIYGQLFGKIIKEKEINVISNNKLLLFPRYCEFNSSKENLEFDEYKKALRFYSFQTNDCKDGCYLLLTYYCKNLKFLNSTGVEYTLLNRIWDEEDFISQIINIPLNEYIFGMIDNTTINTHFYSVYIPEETENITIEIHKENIISYARKGIKNINMIKPTKYSIKLISNEELEDNLIINLNKKDLALNSYKGQYISFSFEKKDLDDNIFSYYYFRILQPNSQNNIIIYPLDTNKAHLCQAKEINGIKACYFILKNDYKDLLNNIVIHGFGKYKINYTIYYMNNTDDDLLDLKNVNQLALNKINIEVSYFEYIEKIDVNFILIELKTSNNNNITLMTNFNKIKNTTQIFDIYSYQLFYLKDKEKIFFHIDKKKNMKVE